MQEAGNVAEGLTTPANLFMMAALPESKILSSIFAMQAASGAFKSTQDAKKSYAEMKNPEAYRQLMKWFSPNGTVTDEQFNKAWALHLNQLKFQMAQQVTGAALEAGIAGVAGSHAVRGTAVAPESLREPGGPQTIEGEGKARPYTPPQLPKGENGIVPVEAAANLKGGGAPIKPLSVAELEELRKQVVGMKPPAAAAPIPVNSDFNVLTPYTEHIPVSVMDKYKEANRVLQPKGDIEALKHDIRQNGIREPLILQYDPTTGTAGIGEGNTRLQAAKELGLATVPVRVMRSIGRRGVAPVGQYTGPETDHRNQPRVPGDLPPSHIGVGSPVAPTRTVQTPAPVAPAQPAPVIDGVDFNPIVQDIRAHIPNATGIEVGGSFARGDMKPKSDIDIIVQLPPGTDQFTASSALDPLYKKYRNGINGRTVDFIAHVQGSQSFVGQHTQRIEQGLQTPKKPLWGKPYDDTEESAAYLKRVRDAEKQLEGNKTTKYKYGNTQADIPLDSEAGKASRDCTRKIDKNDLMPSSNTADSGGLEKDAHITVRYGIDGEDTEGIKAYLEKQPPFEATLGRRRRFRPRTLRWCRAHRGRNPVSGLA